MTQLLRQYQRDAISAWVDKGYRGILEMATGTGKTFTANHCIAEFHKQHRSSITIVIAPSQSIAFQWEKSLDKYEIYAVYSRPNWRQVMNELISKIRLQLAQHPIVIVVQNTAAKQLFLDQVRQIIPLVESSLVVSDEAHGLGSEVFQNALIPEFRARLALSATPVRWFDDEGSALLNEYFGGVAYVFGIREALHWIDPSTGETPLCPYQYFPRFVGLNEKELETYTSLTQEISLKVHQGVKVRRLKSWEHEPEIRELLDLLILRAEVLKSAEEKIAEFRSILLGLTDVNGCLIYCNDRKQMDQVIEVLREFRITYRPFTGEEGTAPLKEHHGQTERDVILSEFSSGRIQALVAMKCLDEGIDVPSARLGIILASTTNPRQFIQRRGRLLRRYPHKNEAIIYDLVVTPSLAEIHNPYLKYVIKKIALKELVRVEAFGRDALNSNHSKARIIEQIVNVGVGH